MSRSDITAILSSLVEKRLNNRVAYWASEVSFDKGTQNWRRIDYMGFKPFTPGYVTMPASVELGEFSCYEIKSCMEDFTSGHGLTFYGDVNYLVTTRELAEQLRVTYRLPRNINQVLTPSKKGDKLVPLFDVSGKCPSYRCRGASEMLYAMIEADGRRTRWKSIARDIAS